MERTTITEFSDEHDVALSKVLDLAIFSAASPTSAVSSIIVTTFPCPTPRAGVPEEYPARTLFWDPVTTNRSASSINRWVLGFEGGVGTIWTKLGSMPTSAKFFRMCSNKTENGSAPFGDGATIIELPVLSAFIMLLVGVASGLVDGTMAAITPLGRK